jgi:superfamily II DNA or RNA helicase
VEATKGVGFTATPERTDGEWVPITYGPLAYAVTTVELIADWHLSDFRILPVPGGLPRTEAIVELTEHLVHELHAQVLVFSESVADAAIQQETIFDDRIIAATLSGDGDEEWHRKVLAWFRAGTVKVVTNFNLLTEGCDLPNADAVIIGRRVTSPLVMSQMIGRVLRIHPGKTYASVYYFPEDEGVSPLSGLLGPDSWNAWLAEGMEQGLTAKEVIDARWSIPEVKTQDLKEVTPYFLGKYGKL